MCPQVLPPSEPAARRDPTLPWIGLALSMAGIGLAMRTVLLPLFAYRGLGASRIQVGLLTGLTTGVSVLASVAIGRTSDRLRRRGALAMGAALWVALGCLGAATVAGRFATLLALGVVCFSLATVPGTILLAIGGDRLLARGTDRLTTRMGILRASISVGFAVGPAVVALVAARASLRQTLAVAAVPWVLSAAIASSLRPSPPRSAAPTGPAQAGRTALPFVTAFALMFTFDATRSAFVAVFAVDELRASMGQVAAVFSTTALLNVALIPLAGALADRFGARRVIAAGGLAGTVGALGFAGCTSIPQLVALQGLHAIYLCGIMSVGVTSAQTLFIGSSGLGMGLFNAASAVGALPAGTLGGLLAARLGWRAPFAASGVACALGLVIALRSVLVRASPREHGEFSGP
jgi:SET family sugar efflux transporter-like MFS transporter